MDYLGLFCLGAFVGAIGTVALKFVSDISGWRQVLVSALPAVLSGIVVVFVDKFKYSPALGCYPLGLLVALLWAYTDSAIVNLTSGGSIKFGIGLAHLFGSILLSAIAGVIVLIPVIMQLRDETS
ncbi:hypothetical protein, partial [Paraburkholderia dilworthii]